MLIVGLGNPGKKYEKTRHNAGYMAIDALGKQNLGCFILAKIDTFMNMSGKSVKELMKSRGIETDDLIVIHDDIDLPVGEFKMQKGRGAAGHKGVVSIIDALRTQDFWRIRIGICPKTGKPENVEQFVLKNFTGAEQKILKNIFKEMGRRLAKPY